MPPNPETGLVTLPEVVTGKLAGKFGEISSLDPPPTRTRRPRGLSYASRLLSHRMWTPHPASASHVVPTMSAGPTRRLPLPAGPARRSYPSATRTPTPPPAMPRTPTSSSASTRTLHTSSTSGRALRSPSPRTTLQSNICQGRLLALL
jgi:hypothetical protein